MRKALAICLSTAMAIALSATALGGQRTARQTGQQTSQTKSIRGTITQVDTNQKMFAVKDESGKQVTVYWNDGTRVSGGELKEGATVTLQATEQGAKTVATSIQVRTKKSY